MDELNESVDGPNFEYNLGNIKILKIGPKHWIRERSKMYGFPQEIQQFWKMELSQQQTRPIAHIQEDLHKAVLLNTLCIDRMHGIYS